MCYPALLTYTANPRSRASKRAASPSMDLDKSIRDAPRASDATPSLAPRPQSGVTKARKKLKPLKRGQRARQEKGSARAEVVSAQLEKKMAGSQSRLKKRRERKAVWDEVNDDAREEQRKTPKFQLLSNGNTENDENQDEWEDESGDTEMKTVDGVQVPATAALTRLLVVDRPASNAGSDLDDIS